MFAMQHRPRWSHTTLVRLSSTDTQRNHVLTTRAYASSGTPWELFGYLQETPLLRCRVRRRCKAQWIPSIAPGAPAWKDAVIRSSEPVIGCRRWAKQRACHSAWCEVLHGRV